MKALRLWWQSWATRRKMNRVFGRGADPYRYERSPYELARLKAMEEALAGRRWRRVLEVGCAEGAFTRRLAGLADSVLAVDLSPVALARARAALAGESAVAFAEADMRLWEPPGGPFDAVVLGDVLYYMDKPLVRDPFEEAFRRLTSWTAPGGRLLLAHGFVGPAEKAVRRGYRERFERLGFALLRESVVGEGEERGEACCLLSVLTKDLKHEDKG